MAYPKDPDNYNYYRKKYLDACSYYKTYDSRVSTYQAQRKTVVNEINALESKIRKYKDAISDMQNVLNLQSDFNSEAKNLSTATDNASKNYTAMVDVEGTTFTLKNVKTEYDPGTTTIKTHISNLFSTVSQKKKNLENVRSDTETSKKNANTRLSNIDAEIKSAKSNRSYWYNKKVSYYAKMMYYYY